MRKNVLTLLVVALATVAFAQTPKHLRVLNYVPDSCYSLSLMNFDTLARALELEALHRENVLEPVYDSLKISKKIIQSWVNRDNKVGVDFTATAAFAEAALDEPVTGIHAFGDADIFSAVYTTNLLMRACDFLVTKPSELAFYPVPKLMIKRVGGHEAWGAIRAAEVGDGTYELETLPEVCAWIDLVQSEPGIVADMCDNIVAADAVGVYDGAYRVVQLACERV